MSNFREKLKVKMERFLAGRNGMDVLARDVYILSIVLLVAGIFSRLSIVYILAMIGLGYSAFRTYSRKIYSRQMENQKYLAFRRKFTKKWDLRKKKWKDRKVYRYYTCKSCKQTIRVPKGKGKIEIRCPKCGNAFIKKT